MDDRIREMQYALRDWLRPLAPPSLSRPAPSRGWIAALVSLAAAGACYGVVRLYEMKLGQLVDHALAERRQHSVRERVPDPAAERLPSDEAAVAEATEDAPPDRATRTIERHRAAAETAGGSL